MSAIDFTGKVALVTGAGRGIGRAYALELARRGAKVLVNDAGVAGDGSGGDLSPAQAVAAEIAAMGGEALADASDITDRTQAAGMVARARERWGALHVLINNAGVLRDRSFAKKDLDDFARVVGVHLWGTVNTTHAAWPLMIEQGYGRILFTTSISGTLGSFGQADYGAAKAGVLGLMNTLAIEGTKRDIRVNAVSPAAGTRMTEGLLPDAVQRRLRPELVVPAALWLVSDAAPTKVALQAGGGMVSRVLFAQTPEIDLGPGATVETLATRADALLDDDRLEPVRVSKAVG